MCGNYVKRWLDDDYTVQAVEVMYALLVLSITVFGVNKWNNWEIYMWVEDSGWKV